MTAASASSQPQEITINESNPPVTTSQLLAQFAAKRGQPYGSIPPPSSAANPNQPDSNSNLLKSKSTRASSIKKSHHHHSISSSPIITESSSGGSNANTPSSSASSSLNSNLNQSSSSDRQSKSQIPSSSVPNDSSPSIPSLYNTSRGRTRNVSPSSRWERRCASANVSSPAASEDGNSTPNANNRIRNGILEGDEVASSTTTTRKGKERQRDDSTNHHEDDRRAISSSRERRKVENWIRKGDADNQEIDGIVSDRVKSSKSRVRRKRKEDEQNSLSSSSSNRHRSSNSMDHSTDQRRRSSLLPPLSPPRCSENNVTFRGRSSTLVPLTSTTSPSPTDQLQSINASSNLAKDQDLKLDRSFTPSLTRPHGALFSSDLDDEVLFSDSCSSDFSSEDALVGEEGITTRSREGLDQENGDSFEDDDEDDEEEEYSVSSTSASNSLISNSRPSLSRSTSTSPNASSEKRSSRSSHRNDSGRVVGRRRNPISEGGGSSSQASSVSPVKRGGILSSIKSENSTSRENIDGKRSRRRKRRISSVERGRRRELRVLLAPPSPASNSNLDLNSNGLETNVDEVGSLSDASKGTQTHSSIRSRISTVGDEDSDREVLEFKSKNQRRGGNSRSEMPTIVDDPMTSPAVSMIRSKSDEVPQQSSTTESQSSTPKLNSSNPHPSSLLNLGQLPGRKWLRNWSSSSSSSQPVSSESRSSSVPSLVPKSSFSPSESNFQRSPRDRTSTVPYFVPADADPLGSNDLDDKDSNDLKEGFAVDDLIQVESVVYDAEEEPPSRRVESPTFSKTSWGKKFSSTMNKSRTNSVSSLASEGGEAQFKLNPNPPTRSSTLLSTSSTLPPVILSAQTSHADGSATEEKLRRTSMNAANEQERRRGFAVAYAARLANVGTNLWNWNRGTNNNQNSNHQRVRSGSIGSSNSTASTIGESEDRPPNAGNQIDSETGNNENSSILASGWRNLTRLPNLILMPASVANPPQQPSPSSLDRINREGQEYDHPALTFLNSSNQVTSEEEREKNEEVLRAQREIALKMGPPSSPSPPASPSFNKSSTSSSLVSSPDLASQNQSLDSSQILGGASKRLSEDQSESRKHQHSSSTSSDSNASATKQSDSSNGRKYSMSTHSKGARGVLSAWEGDFDSGAYVSGLGQPIDPDTELSSVVHLQTFRSRSRDRRDRNELSTHSSSSKESSSKSFDLSKDQSQKQRIGRSASASALDDEDEDEEDEKHVSAAGNRGKRNSLDRIDNSSVRQLDGKLSRREQSRSDGSETMSQNTLLFRYRSPSASTGTATTSTTKKPILAEAQRANLDDKKLASPPTSSSAQLLSSTNASASESALKSLNPALSDPRQDQAAELDSDSKITSQINEEVKGLRRASSLIDFSEQRRFAAREEERKRELQSDLNHRNDNKDGVPPNAVWNLRSRQTRPLMPKRARSYRPAAESPVEEDFCAFPNAISSNGEAEHSDASLSSSSSSTSSSSISSVKDEERIKTSRDGSQREKNGVSRGRSGRACRRRDESPTSSNPRQCAVGLFSAGGHGNRRKSNANSDLSNSSPAPRRDAKSSPNLPGLSRQAERQRENEDADQPVGRIGRRSRRGSKDEEVTQSPSQEVDEGETRGRNSRGRAGDVKVVSSSHGQTACQPYPLPSISLGLNLSSSPSSTSRSRSNRHSNSSNHSHTANGNRNSNHRTGRILPRPSSAPNLGKVLLQATKNQDPSLVNGPNQSKDDQSLVSITSSKSAGELESSENISSTQEPQLNSNATVPSSSDQQAKIPPARAPPQNSQAAQNQSQYSNPTPRPTLLSNGAHLLMLSLELEMIRKRKISAPLKPRWGKQRIRPGVSFTNPSTPIDNGENGGDSTLSSASTSEGVNMRKGSGLRYEVLS